MKDKQGILRGQCTVCECTEYDVSSRGRIKCETCGHVPTRHMKIEGHGNSSDSDGDSHFENSTNGSASKPPLLQSVSGMDSMVVEKDGPVFGGEAVLVAMNDNQDNGFSFIVCQVAGCTKMASYNLNTGQYNSVYCFNHMSVVPTTSQVNDTTPITAPPTIGTLCIVIMYKLTKRAEQQYLLQLVCPVVPYPSVTTPALLTSKEKYLSVVDTVMLWNCRGEQH